MYEVPWRFNQLNGDKVRQMPGCQNHVYVQYEREYIAQALYDAAWQTALYLGFPPAPMWVENEDVVINSDLHWTMQTLQTRFGHVQAFGKRATTLISANTSVSYSDVDEDGLDDTGTISVSGVTNIATDEIQVFFRVEDGAATAGSDLWQIEEVTISKSGDTATITIPRWMLVHPITVWRKDYRQTDTAGWAKFEGDANEVDHFVQAVDVYRVYADTTGAAQLQLVADGAVTTLVNATADLIDAEYGQFTLRTSSTQTAPGSTPKTVKISYKAGLPLTNGRMDAQLERAIIGYANTQMPQLPEMCDRGMAMWKEDGKQSPNAAAYDSWHPPAFGITTAGMKLMEIVNARQNPIKGKATRNA
jgi:hypothetical protein